MNSAATKRKYGLPWLWRVFSTGLRHHEDEAVLNELPCGSILRVVGDGNPESNMLHEPCVEGETSRRTSPEALEKLERRYRPSESPASISRPTV